MTLPESAPLSKNKPPLMHNYSCTTLPESTPPSQSIPPFRHLYGTLPESAPSGKEGVYWKGGGIFWEGGVYSGNVAHRRLEGGILWEGGVYNYVSVAHSCEKWRYILGEMTKFYIHV